MHFILGRVRASHCGREEGKELSQGSSTGDTSQGRAAWKRGPRVWEGGSVPQHVWALEDQPLGFPVWR